MVEKYLKIDHQSMDFQKQNQSEIVNLVKNSYSRKMGFSIVLFSSQIAKRHKKNMKFSNAS